MVLPHHSLDISTMVQIVDYELGFDRLMVKPKLVNLTFYTLLAVIGYSLVILVYSSRLLAIYICNYNQNSNQKVAKETSAVQL